MNLNTNYKILTTNTNNLKNYSLINLEKTFFSLKLCGKILKKLANQKKNIIFIGTKKLHSFIIKFCAKRSKSYYIHKKWLGGLLTNWNTTKKQFDLILKKKVLINTLLKKEQIILNKKIKNITKNFEGILNLKTLPDLAIFSDSFKDKLALEECNTLGIPVICLINNNYNSQKITYPILTNNESFIFIFYSLLYLTNKIKEGYQACL